MTVGELKVRMPMAELGTWVAYVNKNGPFNTALRIESAIARAVAPFMGKNVKPRDLMIWPRQPEPEANIEGVFAMFKGLEMKTKATRNG